MLVMTRTETTGPFKVEHRIDVDGETLENDAWRRTAPQIAVVVATFRRPGLIAALLAALEAQTAAAGTFEVVIVDDGSGDETPSVLRRHVEAERLPLRVVLLPTSSGPAHARNAGAAASRAPLIAFTDDDCIPEPGWLGAFLRAFDGAEIAVVQGRTTPPRQEPSPGPWARTIHVDGLSALFETCNVAYARRWFDQVGGFDEHDAVTGQHGGGSHFGEDAVLGGEVVAAGGAAAFAADAVVHHRWEPTPYAGFLRARWRLVGFPALAKRSPAVARRLTGGVFLSKRTASADLAAAGAILALLTRRPAGVAAAVVTAIPWLRQHWPEARSRAHGKPVVLRLAQLAGADAVGLAALVTGSIRHRRVVL
jgi:hypothetical protein